MTTSASTTFSPSRRRTTRSTPCVLGCCGPMLMTSSFVSNMALLDVPRCPHLEPVGRALEQQLARPLERVILPLRVSLPFVGHEDAPQVGMSAEPDAEEVEDLPLEPV